MKKILMLICLMLIIGISAFSQVLLNGNVYLYRDEGDDGKVNINESNKFGEFVVRMTASRIYAFNIKNNSVMTGDVFIIDKKTYAILINQGEESVAVYYGAVGRDKIRGTWFNLVTKRGGDFEMRIRD